MNWQKNVILAAIGVVVWLLVVRWSAFDAQFESLAVADQPSQIPVEQLYNESPASGSTLPVLVNDQYQAATLLVNNQQNVTITTDVIKVTIDTLGGDVVEAKLLQHLNKMANEGGQPISILTRSNGNEFIAESGLIGANGTDTAAGRPVFSTAANSYELTDGQQTLEVDFVYKQAGVEIIKRFEFKASQYQVGIVGCREFARFVSKWAFGL